MELDQRSIDRLVDAGYIDRPEDNKPKEVDAYEEGFPEPTTSPDSGLGEYDQLPFKFNYKGPIEKSDWAPESVIEHTQEFIRWIDSINSGFQNMVRYEPFIMYCQQAEDWLKEDRRFSDCSTRQEKREFVKEEVRRFKQNALYFLDKYLPLKEADMVGGTMKYRAKPVHKVLCYLFDCGYSFIAGKPRQIAATSTLGGISILYTMTSKNFFLKFVAQDDKKTEEIFQDKIKYPFYELEKWMKPYVSNDQKGMIRFSKKKKQKSDSPGINSSIRVQAPSRDAINGGSPNLVMVDEAGYNKYLSDMIMEARPTLFMTDPATGKLTLKRQIIIWGTGGEMDKAGKDYEEEFWSRYEAWNKGQYDHGMVPVFFDWTTRPGITREFYENEKNAYLAGSKSSRISMLSEEERLIKFRQHYPSCPEDMFLTSSKTLLPISHINQKLANIKNLPHEQRAVYGYFEPIYDYTRPEDENSDVPYVIRDAQFVPTEDGDERASVMMFLPPYSNWTNRYVQGTDPIASDNGYSKMASVVLDREFMTVAACLNHRDENHHNSFLQTVLMGLYYDNRTGIKFGCDELIENNIGTAYRDYKERKGMYKSLMTRYQLPIQFQMGGGNEGVDTRGNRKRDMVDKLVEFFRTYGDRVYIPEIWVQLRNFTCTFTEAGQEKWGVTDHKKYRDDLVDALGFAYIAHLALDNRTPREDERQDGSGNRVRTRYKLKRRNGKLTRVAETKQV